MSSYRRQLLDKDLEQAQIYMNGIVLDIGGGRRRGNFKEPVKVEWITLDMERKFAPSILADAQNLPIKNNSVDCIKSTELLEHVEHPERVIKEMARALKSGGILILSMPFMFPVHADPYDFQRYTDYKLARMFNDDFEIIKLKKQGLFFTVLAFMIKQVIVNSRSGLRRIFYPLYPILDLMVKLDSLDSVKNSKYMNSFTTGYFVIAKRK